MFKIEVRLLDTHRIFYTNYCFKNGSDESLGWCVSEGLAHPHNTDPIVKKWLQNTNINDFIVSIVDKQINSTCSPELSVLLKLALTEDNEGGTRYLYSQVNCFSDLFSFRALDTKRCALQDYRKTNWFYGKLQRLPFCSGYLH